MSKTNLNCLDPRYSLKSLVRILRGQILARSSSSHLLRITAASGKKYDAAHKGYHFKTLPVSKSGRTLICLRLCMTGQLSEIVPLLFAIPRTMEVDQDWKC